MGLGGLSMAPTKPLVSKQSPNCDLHCGIFLLAMGNPAWKNLFNNMRRTAFTQSHADCTTQWIEETMQLHYPGAYSVENFYSTQIHCTDYRLKFNSPEDETWFYLKWK